MKITVDGTVYDYDPNALTLKEARLLNRQAGLGFTELTGGRFADPQVLTAIIWLCRYRDGEYSLKFDDVDVPLTAISIDVEVPQEETPTQATPSDNSAGSPSSSIG